MNLNPTSSDDDAAPAPAPSVLAPEEKRSREKQEKRERFEIERRQAKAKDVITLSSDEDEPTLKHARTTQAQSLASDAGASGSDEAVAARAADVASRAAEEAELKLKLEAEEKVKRLKTVTAQAAKQAAASVKAVTKAEEEREQEARSEAGARANAQGAKAEADEKEARVDGARSKFEAARAEFAAAQGQFAEAYARHEKQERAALGAKASLSQAESTSREAKEAAERCGAEAKAAEAAEASAVAAAAEAALRANAASAVRCGCIGKLVASDNAARQATLEAERLQGESSALKGGAAQRKRTVSPPTGPPPPHVKLERNSRPPSAASSSSSSSTTAAGSSSSVKAVVKPEVKAGVRAEVKAEAKAGGRKAGRTGGRTGAEAEAKAGGRAEAKARKQKAQADAITFRKAAELEEETAIVLEEPEEEGEQQQELTPVDELANLLDLLYNQGLKPPQVPVQNAEQLVEVLRRDPAWFERVSKGMSVARREGGKMDEDRLMSLFADPTEGQRVAQVLRKRNAKRHWSLGQVETELSRNGDAFGTLHNLMQARTGNKTDKVRMTGAKTPWLTVKEWGESKKQQKVLHWPVRSDEAISPLVEYPEWLQRNNWVDKFDDKTFDVMLQLVHSHAETGAHFDNNACDTWMKLLAGKVLVATWSLKDALQYGTEEFCHHSQHPEYEPAKAMDWDKLHEMPSGRLFWLRPGDVLVLPAGTFHYVYTVLKKLVVAGDFCNASGWRARVASAEEWLKKQDKGKKDKDAVELVDIFVHGLEKVELPRLERGEAPSLDRRTYLREILAWAEQLRIEAYPEEGQAPANLLVRRALERPAVQRALAKVRECLALPHLP